MKQFFCKCKEYDGEKGMKKDSNNDFWNKWKVERKYGFKKYYI